MGTYVLIVIMSLGYGGTNVHTEHFASEAACKAAIGALEAGAKVVNRESSTKYQYFSAGCVENKK